MRLLKLPVRNTLWIFSYTRLSRIIRDAQPTTIRLFCDHEPFGHQLSTCAWRFAAPLGVAAVAWYLCLLKHFGSDVLHFRLAQTQRKQKKKQSETPWITGKTKTKVFGLPFKVHQYQPRCLFKWRLCSDRFKRKGRRPSDWCCNEM